MFHADAEYNRQIKLFIYWNDVLDQQYRPLKLLNHFGILIEKGENITSSGNKFSNLWDPYLGNSSTWLLLSQLRIEKISNA